jgi:hypothetical protein
VIEADVAVAGVIARGCPQFIGDRVTLGSCGMPDMSSSRQPLKEIGGIQYSIGGETRVQMFKYLQVAPQPPKVRLPEPTRRWHSLSPQSTDIFG